MKAGIMQPYFLPYLGYFQLMNACDQFVVYDNIQFTKKGWIHRNRMLLNGKDMMFTLPLKNDSDYLNVDHRFLGENYGKEKAKILGQIKSSYSKAPLFKTVFPIIEDIFNDEERNLFRFIFNSLKKLCNYLDITTPLIVSSTLPIDHSLKGKYKVMAVIKELGADTYLNPIGGMELYSKEEFAENGITLQFHKMKAIVYPQFSNEFIPFLSILDVMMFNDKTTIQGLLKEFDLL
jgi:hypothetical protein